jgi:Na+/H+ antiporter NhaA
VLLLAATVVALVWVNVDSHSYSSLWTTRVSVEVGDSGIALDLRGWINSGLMTFFFFVIGLEARREFDLGELRDRRRLVLPTGAALGGAFGAVAIYLAINAGRPSAHGWGVAMSTDTAFALGLLALVGPRFPDRLRAFLLTVAVVDDLVALVVIVFFYSSSIDVTPLLVAVAFYAAALVLHRARVRVGLVYLVLGAGAWVGLLEAGVEPIVIGLALGVLPYAYTPRRSALELATERFREFREQPTAGLARTAVAELRAATPPNERLQQLYHPWTSYGVVPLFALANAGIVVDGDLLERAVRSPITLGIVLGYLFGKPIGITGVSWLVTRASRGRLRPPVGWAAVLGGGTIAGIGFTVSLLVATIAFGGAWARRGKSGGARFRAHRRIAHVDPVPGDGGPAAAVTRAGIARLRPDHERPLPRRRPGARPHSRAARRSGHARGVRRLRVPVLRSRRARRARPATGVRRRRVRLAQPAAERRARARPAGR